jgi:hypothetical protein
MLAVLLTLSVGPAVAFAARSDRPDEFPGVSEQTVQGVVPADAGEPAAPVSPEPVDPADPDVPAEVGGTESVDVDTEDLDAETPADLGAPALDGEAAEADVAEVDMIEPAASETPPDGEELPAEAEETVVEIEDAEVPAGPAPSADELDEPADESSPVSEPEAPAAVQEPVQEAPEEPLEETPVEIPAVDVEPPPAEAVKLPLALKVQWPADAPAPDESPEFEILLSREGGRFTYLLAPGAGPADVFLPDGVYEVGPGYVPLGYRFVLLSADGEESDSATVTVRSGISDRRGVTLVYEASDDVFGHVLTVDFLVGPGPSERSGEAAPADDDDDTPESDAAEPDGASLDAAEPEDPLAEAMPADGGSGDAPEADDVSPDSGGAGG